MVHFPINLVIGNAVIPSHLILEFLAYTIAIIYYIKLRNKKGDKLILDNRFSIILGGAIGALIFAKILGALENIDVFLNDPSFIYFIQSKTVVGGIIGAIIGVEITKKIIKEKYSSGDLFTFPLIVGMIIGRIGCFLTGVSDKTVGIVSNSFLAFDQGDGLPRYPTALFEIVFLVVLFFTLKFIDKKIKLKDGNLFKLFIITYMLFRFAIEFIKPMTPIFLGLSAIQISALIMALVYIYVIGKKGLYDGSR